MIQHLSSAAPDPNYVAGILVKVAGGVAVPFPPNPGSFFAFQLDEHGWGAEVHQAGTELPPSGNNSGRFVRKPEVHRHGPILFVRTEVLVENESMDEILPPDFARIFGRYPRQARDCHGGSISGIVPSTPVIVSLR